VTAKPRPEDYMKIKKTSLPDEICENIKASIKNGTLKRDDKLPSEKDLSEMFGVNRLTVRIALQKLNAQGIVDTRVGEGTYVKNFDFSDYIGEVSDFYLTQEMIDNVCEFRKSLEVECARLAIDRATDEEIDVMGPICDQYEAICRKLFSQEVLDADTLEELVEKDLEFHHQIVLMSKNTLYHYSFEVARQSILRYLHMILTLRIDNAVDRKLLLEKGHRQHRIIYRTIRERDFQTCREAILTMIDYTVDL